MAPSSQLLEPSGNSGRFSLATDTDLADVTFVTGQGSSQVRWPAIAWMPHPSLDVGILTLGVAVPGAQPLRLASSPLDDAMAGAAVEAAGAGLGTAVADLVDFGVFFAVSLSDVELEIDRDAPGGLCRGDSGGPWFVQSSEGARIVATSSRGGVACEGPDWGVRIDLVAPWIDEQVAMPVPPSLERCDISEPSTCDDDTEVRCKDGWSHRRACSASGSKCGWRNPDDGWGCLAGVCGAIDWRGACAEGKARWCNGSQVLEQDCHALSLACDRDVDAGGFR